MLLTVIVYQLMVFVMPGIYTETLHVISKAPPPPKERSQSVAVYIALTMALLSIKNFVILEISLSKCPTVYSFSQQVFTAKASNTLPHL